MQYLKKNILIITGSVGVGKTSFLLDLIPLLKKNWPIDGFISLPSCPQRVIGESAAEYKIKFLHRSKLLPWAQKRENGRGYHLNKQTQKIVTQSLLKGQATIMVLDDLGPYELKGEGFSLLLQELKTREDQTLIMVVKKRVLHKFISHFQLDNTTIFDLDTHTRDTIQEEILKKLYQLDGEKIGLFATIAGLVEVTIGPTLSTLHIPLKGHIMTLIQSFLLIQFAKELKGRGLIQISAITAGIKSFSPVGAKLKPMFYIFMQGLLFSLPISLLGVNIFSILLGSLLLGVATIYLSLSLNYLIYGAAYLESIKNMLELSSRFLHLESYPFWTTINMLALVKTVVIVLIMLPAYYFNFSKLLDHFKMKINQQTTNRTDLPSSIKTFTWIEAIKAAFKDLTLKRFIIPFMLTTFIIYFFAHLSLEQFSFVIIRALIISWFGFVIARRINFTAIIRLLRQKGRNNWADGLEYAVKTIQKITSG